MDSCTGEVMLGGPLGIVGVNLVLVRVDVRHVLAGPPLLPATGCSCYFREISTSSFRGLMHIEFYVVEYQFFGRRVVMKIEIIEFMS